MSSGASHYRDAEALMKQADESALNGRAAMAASDDWNDAVPFLLGAVVSLVAALDHAVLANAAATAMNIRRAGAIDEIAAMAQEWREVLKDAQDDPHATT